MRPRQRCKRLRLLECPRATEVASAENAAAAVEASVQLLLLLSLLDSDCCCCFFSAATWAAVAAVAVDETWSERPWSGRDVDAMQPDLMLWF